jgi:Fic family protein
MEYLSISQIILKSKNQYALAYLYSEYDELDLTYFIRYNVECMNSALEELIKYLEFMQESQLKAQEIARSRSELTQRQAEILIELIENLNQEYTILQLSEKFAISRETARTDLQFLENGELITKMRRGKIFYYYVNDDNLKKIDQNNPIPKKSKPLIIINES